MQHAHFVHQSSSPWLRTLHKHLIKNYLNNIATLLTEVAYMVIRWQILLSKGVTRNWEMRIFMLLKSSCAFTGSCWFLARSKCKFLSFGFWFFPILSFKWFEISSFGTSHCLICWLRNFTALAISYTFLFFIYFFMYSILMI